MSQELLLSREGNLLQSEAAFLQSGAGNKVGQELLQSRSAPRYYKVGQKLLQSGQVIYYKVRQAIYYKVGQLIYSEVRQVI